MIETEQQRRWWFATHPEYSWTRTGQRSNGQDSGESDWKTEARSWLKRRKEPAPYDQGFQDGMRWALDPNRGPKPPLVLNRDCIEGFYAAVDKARTHYRLGWEDGYHAVKKGNALPEAAKSDRSAYAYGLRAGAAAALDEEELWTQKWIDPFLIFLGTHPSRTLGRNLEKAGELRPSPDYDAHHIIPFRHWRADPLRKILKKFDIPIDGAENGAWLPRGYHQTLTNSRQYYDALKAEFLEANSRTNTLKILGKIKRLFSTGKFPP